MSEALLVQDSFNRRYVFSANPSISHQVLGAKKSFSLVDDFGALFFVEGLWLDDPLRSVATVGLF